MHFKNHTTIKTRLFVIVCGNVFGKSTNAWKRNVKIFKEKQVAGNKNRDRMKRSG